jgi:dTDP-4-dehydrorhamnose 3,5-epimerase
LKAIPTKIEGVVIVESPVFADERGAFTEVFHADKFAALGLPMQWAQDNHSRSVANVLRGLHFQRTNPQGKLVRAVRGRIFDVAVDIRDGSPTFGKWFGVTLEAGDGRQLYIPPGLAHGFLVLSADADVSYKCTTVYDAASDTSLLWSDSAIDIGWPLPIGVAPLLSPKDAAAKVLSAIAPMS